MCISSHAHVSESAKSTIDCATYRSCRKCANEQLCSWSLENQNCVQPQELGGSLMVHVMADCPQFTVNKLSWLKDITYTYRLTVSNDKKDFMAYLRNLNITCLTQTDSFKGRVDQNVIKCDGIRRTYIDFLINNKQMIYFYYIMLNNNSVILRLDNDSDYYVQYYDHECGNKQLVDCITCSWTEDEYINYFKRCTSANQCLGLYQFYDRRHVQNFTTTAIRTTAVTLQCADVGVQSIKPGFAPWTGSTVVRVTVKNHRILSEKKSVRVILASHECDNPKLVNHDTIECTVSPRPKPEVSDVDRIAEGSVEVEYISPLQKFKIVSTFPFTIVSPQLTDVSPTCGPLSGRTPLTVVGKHLNYGTTVQVVVGNKTMCTAVVRSPDRISCLTGAAEAPTNGVVSALFDGILTETANRQSFVYTDNPVLDVSQPLAGIVSGGTAVLVHGRHFSCALNTTMSVHLHNGTVHRTGCKVHNDTFMMCRSPSLSVDDFQKQYVQTTTIATENDNAEPTPIGTLKFELEVAYVGGLMAKPRSGHGGAMPRYNVYADPVLDDFSTNDHAITVIGRNLDWGYAQYQGNDTVVQLLLDDNLTVSTMCDVTSVHWHRIVCVPKAVENLDTVRSVSVTFGVLFRRVVHRQPTRPVDDSRQFWTYGRTTVVVAVILVLLLCCAYFGLRKFRNRYKFSISHFELQTPESKH